ncbi:hypothetical protein BKA81DRAFT_395775 [Phyllosticta paracitricarpa]
MGESKHSRNSSSSSSTKPSQEGDSPSTTQLSIGSSACGTDNQQQQPRKSEMEHPSLEASPQHIVKKLHGEQVIEIHSDGRFMSALRAIHASDQGEAAVSKRRTNTAINTVTKKGLRTNTGPQSPDKKSPSPIKKPRRKLQRSRAFSIDRSPSPSGRVCELEDDQGVGEDELCALFKKIGGGP